MFFVGKVTVAAIVDRGGDEKTALGGNIVGGLIFGIGHDMLIYCPRTKLGAFGQKRWDAVWGIICILVGAAMYPEVYPFMKKTC